MASCPGDVGPRGIVDAGRTRGAVRSLHKVFPLLAKEGTRCEMMSEGFGDFDVDLNTRIRVPAVAEDFPPSV